MKKYRFPYYIVTPRYIRTSGGVRTLFRLADLINKAGGDAFIFLWPRFNHDLASSPMDVAPFLTKKTADYHFANGFTPIIIYPETTKISRFNPPVRVRYLLNYDELFFENEPLTSDDFLLCYSQEIANRVKEKIPSSILYLPVSDHMFFSPDVNQVIRHGGAFYAGKFKYRFGGKTFPITDGLPEITRDMRNSQTPEQIRDLFRRIEFFYCYEDSALALEAILCGCPVIFLPNEYFTAPLAGNELQFLGFAWGASSVQMLHAKTTVVAAREQYLSNLVEIDGKLRGFLEQTQSIATEKHYEVPFAESYLRFPGLVRQLVDLVIFLKDVFLDRGFIDAIKIIFKRIMARRFDV